MEILINIIGGLAVLAITFTAGLASDSLNRRRRFGYLRNWLGNGRGVIILLPNFRPYCKGDDFISHQPANVLLMPAAEGSALARLVIGIRKVKHRVNIQIINGDKYPWNPDHLPVISIGGPSVNDVSKELLAYHPDFGISYPQHDAHVGNISYKPRQTDGAIVEDYGFTATGEHMGAPYAVLFGVYSAGTWAATQTFINLQSKIYRKKLARREPLFLVSHTEVHGLLLDETWVELVDPQPIKVASPGQPPGTYPASVPSGRGPASEVSRTAED